MTALGALNARMARQKPPQSLREAEYKVFSQWNEDGIIQWLIDHVDMPPPTFIEIGVGDYAESNTRFLASHNGWAGAVYNYGNDHINFIKRSGLDWRYRVRGISSFVTAENVNQLVQDAGYRGDIGLLSIDVDGVDYWLLDAINAVRPHILVMEYNAAFGSEAAITVPYKPDFGWDRTRYHGASLAAIAHKASELGYQFVGCESHGANAFFVRRDVTDLQAVEVAAGFRPSNFVLARTAAGDIDYDLTLDTELRAIGARPLVDVYTGRSVTVSQALLP